jgi:ribosome-binding factor A
MAKRQETKGPSQRQLRVGEIIRHALAQIITRHEVPDPVLSKHVITVPEVRMSPDLKIATCYVMPLGGKDIDLVVATLERSKKPLRLAIAKHIRDMKFCPELRFRRDESFDEAARIDALLDSDAVRRDMLAPKTTINDIVLSDND